MSHLLLNKAREIFIKHKFYFTLLHTNLIKPSGRVSILINNNIK